MDEIYKKNLAIKALREENTTLKIELAKLKNEKIEVKNHFNKMIFANYSAWKFSSVDAWKKETNENFDQFVILPLKKVINLFEEKVKQEKTPNNIEDFSLLPKGKL